MEIHMHNTLECVPLSATRLIQKMLTAEKQQEKMEEREHTWFSSMAKHDSHPGPDETGTI